MSDPNATPTPTSELAELTKGSTVKPPALVDKSGKSWDLIPLDLSDIVEYEEKIGTSLFSENMTTIKAREIMFLMYLSIRKTACTEADIEAKKYKFPSFVHFLRAFDLKAFVESAKLLATLLKLSGLDADAENPQKANQ